MKVRIELLRDPDKASNAPKEDITLILQEKRPERDFWESRRSLSVIEGAPPTEIEVKAGQQLVLQGKHAEEEMGFDVANNAAFRPSAQKSDTGLDAADPKEAERLQEKERQQKEQQLREQNGEPNKGSATAPSQAGAGSKPATPTPAGGKTTVAQNPAAVVNKPVENTPPTPNTPVAPATDSNATGSPTNNNK